MNQVNNDPKCQRYQIVAADNERGNMDENDKFQWALVRGDLWGTNDAVRDFTDETTPSSLLTDGSTLAQPIYSIGFDADGCMSFVFKDASLVGIADVPVASLTDGIRQVYDLSGKSLSGQGTLTKGLYIVREGGVVKKVLVK